MGTCVMTSFPTGRKKPRCVALFIFMVKFKLLCDVMKAELRSKVHTDLFRAPTGQVRAPAQQRDGGCTCRHARSPPRVCYNASPSQTDSANTSKQAKLQHMFLEGKSSPRSLLSKHSNRRFLRKTRLRHMSPNPSSRTQFTF